MVSQKLFMTTSFKTLANANDEILDLVDREDNIIGRVSRKIANSNPSFIHREVAIVIFDKKNYVLLEQRSKYKNVNPLVWSTVAGHVLAGQNPEEAAHQELVEEVGFDTKLVFVNKFFHSYSWETHFTYLYLAFYEGQKIIFPQTEVVQIRFVDKFELKKLSQKARVNQNLIKIINDFWSGKYDAVKKQLKIVKLI